MAEYCCLKSDYKQNWHFTFSMETSICSKTLNQIYHGNNWEKYTGDYQTDVLLASQAECISLFIFKLNLIYLQMLG